MPYKDPERARRYRKEYYQKNKRWISEKDKVYRLKNKKHIDERNRQYVKNNLERYREYQKQYRPVWQKNNPEKCREYAKKFRTKNRPKYMKARRKYERSEKGKRNARKQNLKNKGITLEQYDQMFELQGGVCAICGNPEIAKNQFGIRRLAVDHNHATGKSRGLLCVKCNTGLGSFSVDEVGIELLLKAIEYVRRYSE